MCTLESTLISVCGVVTFLITQMYVFPQMDETHDGVGGNDGSAYQFHAGSSSSERREGGGKGRGRGRRWIGNNATRSPKRPKAHWDDEKTALFIKLCREQQRLGNKPLGTLTSIGYANLINRFEEECGIRHSHIQMKNKWDQLKREWQAWKTLLGCEA